MKVSNNVLPLKHRKQQSIDELLKIMKTYISITKSSGMKATLANNKEDAFIKINSKFPCNKGSVAKSSCHIDYVSCDKI